MGAACMGAACVGAACMGAACAAIAVGRENTGTDVAADALADSVADDVDEPVRHGGSTSAGEQGRGEDAGLRTSAGDESAREVVEESRSQQVVREHGAGTTAAALFDEVVQRHSPAGEEADLDGPLELCRQQPAHLTAGLVRSFVARTGGGEDDLVVAPQERKSIDEDLCEPRIRAERGRPSNITARFSGTTERLGEVDMDVIARREQKRHENDRTIGGQSGDHLVDVGLLDVDMPENHLVGDAPNAQVSGDLRGEHLDEDLTRRR